MAGTKDPLFDDSIRLLERLTRDKINCKLLLYKDFSHGFMSMDQVLPGCKRAIDDSII
jgi:acetyl esterase/lipase